MQEAIINRLQTRSGLDLKTVEVNTTDVSFDKNKAFATVSFHPKGDASVADGMTMKYTLEFRDGQWAVVNVADSRGNGLAGHPGQGGDTLPPGHPGQGEGILPPGHPSVGGSSRSSPIPGSTDQRGIDRPSR